MLNIQKRRLKRGNKHSNRRYRMPGSKLEQRKLGGEQLECRQMFSVDASSMLVAVGDTDGDGIDEVFTGMNTFGNVQIYRSDKVDRSNSPQIDGADIGTPIYNSVRPGEWTLQALAVGDVDADGIDELFAAFEHESGHAYIYRSDTGYGIGGRIYRSRRPELFTVQALAVADTNGDGNGELFSAFKAEFNGDALIYRSESGLGIGGRIYSSAHPGNFTIQAMAAGDVDGDGDDELFTAFKAEYDGNALIYRSETGSGIGGRIYKSKFPGTFTITALAVGDADDNGRAELYSAFQTNWNRRSLIYRSTSGNTIGTRIYTADTSSPLTFTVKSMAVGDADGDQKQDFLSTFDRTNGDAMLYRSHTGRGIGSKYHVERWSNKHLFLNFNGGNSPEGFVNAFEWDMVSGRSHGERRLIEAIKDHVVEDFAPFDIHVTTVRPARGRVFEVMIGGDNFDSNSDSSGLAPANAFKRSQPVYVFPDEFWIQNFHVFAQKVGTTASHEAGHGFGLVHKTEMGPLGNQLDIDGNGQLNANDDYSRGNSVMTPIMGANLSTDRTIWTQRGAYVGNQPNLQPRFLGGNDSVRILETVLGRRRDDRVNPVSFGTISGSTKHVSAGLIEHTSDVDVFLFDIPPQTAGLQTIVVHVNVPKNNIGNLDSRVRLVGPNGVSLSNGSAQEASIILPNARAGRYRLEVGSAASFSGDIGTYEVSVQAPILRFGDFDGDGRTDVFRVTPNNEWHVASPGISGWKKVASSTIPVEHLRFGDFDGDGRTDVFRVAPNNKWQVASPGISGWKTVASSGFPIEELQFGDFDGDGRTDVLRLSPNNTWQVASPGISGWQSLGFLDMSIKEIGGIRATIENSEAAEGPNPDMPVSVNGDITNDGVVDFSDFLVLSDNFGKQVDDAFSHGDLTGDGRVSFEDFLLLAERL